MSETEDHLCPDADIAGLLAAINQSDDGAMARLDPLLERYGGDARLHFLRGSLLAGAGDYDGALAAMARAVEIAPGYEIARFQFGFLTLTCGDGAGALAIWEPFGALAPDHYLRLFAEGLAHMVRDEFGPAEERLARGIGANTDNEPLNADMQLVREEIARITVEDGGPGDDSPASTSSAQSLLRQYAAKSTKH